MNAHVLTPTLGRNALRSEDSASRLHGLIAIFLLLVMGISAQASPRDDLLRLVPEDVTFCAVVQDLRERTKNAKDGVALERLFEMPLVKAQLASPEIKKLLAIKDQIFKELRVTPEQIRDDLLGDSFAFAYRQGPADQPVLEQGLFLVWARDKALLAQVVDRINGFQKKSGELQELRELKHSGQTYIHRVRVKGNESSGEFYLLRDNLIAFSPHESAIKSVIDRDAKQPAADKEKPFWTKMLDRLGLDKSLAVLMINPRVFDIELGSLEKKAQGPEQAFLKEFRRYWQAFDGIGLYAEVIDRLELGLAVNVRKDDLPKAAQQFFTELGKPSSLWKVIPEDALFALSARTDFKSLAEVFAGFCDEGKLTDIRDSIRGSLRPFLPENTAAEAMLKGLGPDWGLWITAPSSADKTWVPEAIWAMKLQDSPDGKAAETTIRNAIQFLTTAAQFSAKEKLSVETLKDGKVEIKYLTSNAFPPGFRPAFAVKDGYLLFAGSPKTIQKFAAPPALPAMEEAPFLRISAKAWAGYLATHKTEVAGFLAALTGSQPKDIESHIDELIPNLTIFDRLDLVAKSGKDTVTIVLRLKLAAK